ncbi:MAG: energy coupling factor transporter S component ThiW [Defluviitaleaceae bacterium]|nr:energy coupling factor transporter S component ThiW [Defluviitaleaceae bacterium]
MKITRNTQKLAVAGLLVAVGVLMSAFSIPVGIARVFPVQHMVNVIAGVMFGPFYAVIMAFCTSVIRNIMGTGTLLAFPGSMFGALLAGLAAKMFRGRLLPACAGELVGTGVFGAIVAYPVAAFILGRDAAIFTFVIPFTLSSVAGATLALAFLIVLSRTPVNNWYRNILKGEVS